MSQEMSQKMKLEKADIRLFFAASGCGKSYLMKKDMRGHKRVIVWDAMAEYDGTVIDTRSGLISAIKNMRFKVSYRPDFSRGIKEEFDFFCRAAWARGQSLVVVEELNQVTNPNWSPPAWRNLTSRGRHRGIHIFGASQRPGSVDKDAIGNAAEIYAGRLPYDGDRRALQAQFGRSEAEKLANMPVRRFLDWKADG